jgi:hypothetical protein
MTTLNQVQNELSQLRQPRSTSRKASAVNVLRSSTPPGSVIEPVIGPDGPTFRVQSRHIRDCEIFIYPASDPESFTLELRNLPQWCEEPVHQLVKSLDGSLFLGLRNRIAYLELNPSAWGTIDQIADVVRRFDRPRRRRASLARQISQALDAIARSLQDQAARMAAQ